MKGVRGWGNFTCHPKSIDEELSFKNVEIQIHILADTELVKYDNEDGDLIKVSSLVDTLYLRFTTSLLHFFGLLIVGIWGTKQTQISNYKQSLYFED